VPNSLRVEINAMKDMFLPDVEEGSLAQYRVIREKMSALDTLADSFAFNWSKKRKEEELKFLMESESVQSEADRRANMEIATRPGNLGMEEIQEIKGRNLQAVAIEDLDAMVARHSAHKYIVGVYQGKDYHVGNLKKIYHYFFDAAKKDNPIAQYHIAIFLLYFGDILGMARDEVEQSSQDWLQRAYTSDVTRNRVVEINTLLAVENRKTEKRKEETANKIEKLVSLEHEKMDMVENVLFQTAKRVKIINELRERLIKEMERERERQATIQKERIRAWSMVEATRLAGQAMVNAERVKRAPTMPLPEL
jgi:hypothetical protein